jgi:hypothetical protein
MTRLAKLLGAVSIALTAGCNGGGGTSDAGNLPADADFQISAASDTDKMNLCNWYTAMVGGYGAAPTCSTPLLKAPPSEATCVTDFPSCAVPVSTFKACVLTIISAQATCTQASIAMAQQDPSCVKVGSAGCFN